MAAPHRLCDRHSIFGSNCGQSWQQLWPAHKRGNGGSRNREQPLRSTLRGLSQIVGLAVWHYDEGDHEGPRSSDRSLPTPTAHRQRVLRPGAQAIGIGRSKARLARPWILRRNSSTSSSTPHCTHGRSGPRLRRGEPKYALSARRINRHEYTVC